jgi:hypothetical protein
MTRSMSTNLLIIVAKDVRPPDILGYGICDVRGYAQLINAVNCNPTTDMRHVHYRIGCYAEGQAEELEIHHDVLTKQFFRKLQKSIQYPTLSQYHSFPTSTVFFLAFFRLRRSLSLCLALCISPLESPGFIILSSCPQRRSDHCMTSGADTLCIPFLIRFDAPAFC